MSRSCLSRRSCSLLLLCVSGGISLPAFGTNLLTNPGFETGNNSGWTMTGLFNNAVLADNQPLSASPPYSFDLSNVRTGSFSCAIGFNGSSASSMVMSQPVATVAGTTYLVGHYGSTGNAGGGSTTTTNFAFVPPGSDVQVSLVSGTTSSNFTSVRTLITAPTNNATFTASIRSAENGTQSFDDFYVEAYAVGTNPFGKSATKVSRNDSAAGNGAFLLPAVPLQNNNADFAFSTTLTSTTATGVFKQVNGTLLELARTGANAPLAVGQFGTFGVPQINASGQSLFWSRLTGTSGGGANDDRMYLNNSTTGLTQIAVEGQPSPDGNGQFGPLSWLGSAPQQLNDSGRAMFYVNFEGSAGGVNELDGYMYWNGSALSHIVRRGYAIPSQPGWTHGVASTPQLSESGSVAWSTGIQNSSTTGDAIFIYNGATRSLLARDGQTVPGGNGVYDTFSEIRGINAANEFGFSAGLTGTSGGATDNTRLYLRRTSGIVQLASEGQTAPDSNGQFSTFAPGGISDAGQVVFFSNLTGSASTSGIFRSEADLSLNTIARVGAPTPEGDGNFASLASPLIGPAGQIAFTATTSTTTQSSLYIGDDRELLLVARWGYEVDGKVVNSAISNNTAPTTNGQITYRASFADGSLSILTFTPRLTWKGAATGSWNTQNDWTLRINPNVMHEVLVASSHASLLVTGPTANKTIKQLQIGDATGLADLRLLSMGVLAATDGTLITTNGILSGNGTLVSDVENHGMISPGTSPGTLSINGDLASDGTLDIEIASLVSMDKLIVNGDVDLAGIVSVELLGTFAPQVGDSFDVLDWTGTFTSTGITFDFSQAPLTPGLAWDTSAFNTSGILSITLVPEPMTATMLLAAAGRRRRRSM